jgi:HK97 family phage major capsid protein
MFTESSEYKGMNKNQPMPKSEAMELKGFFEQKTTLTGASIGNTANYLGATRRFDEIIRNPFRDLHVRDLLPVRPTGQSSIEYFELDTFTNNAAMVAEKAYSDSAKPESAITFAIKTATAKTVAHWLPVTRQMLQDAPQIRAFIDDQLIEGLKLVEDVQLLYGDGTGNNLPGIMTNAGAQTYAWSAGEVDDNKADAIRRAMTLIRLEYLRPNGVVLHPNDWEDIELMKGSDKHYIWIDVNDGGVPRLWRLPVVETPAITEGDFLVGDFMQGVTLWDREEANIRVSEHRYFTQNVTVILAEERLMLTNFRPYAFVVGEFDEAPS